MIVFHVDLDNTLIYSCRHDIGQDKLAVETYQGKEMAFITRNTYEQLKKLKQRKDLLIVPTSTRSIEQYKRIDLQIGRIEYALVCNGGVLLTDGTKDAAWYEESRSLIENSRPALEIAHALLEQDVRRYFELRWIEDLFLFTKCTQPELVVTMLQETLHTNVVDIIHNKEKIYVIPTSLNKGTALQRFRNLVKADQVIAAGDSEFDISMLQAADMGIAPYMFEGKEIFSEKMLQRVSEFI